MSFTAATKLQQQQYVRHVQHDIPGSRSTPAPQPQWQSFQAEARNRNKSGNNTEPVFSYQQLFDQDMTPTYNVSTSAPRLSRQGSQSSSSSKGFGSKAKARRSGGSSSAGGSGSAGPSQPAVPGTAHVQLCITKAVEYGQNMRVTGSGPDFGSWDANKGPKLRWSEGHKWTADVTLPAGGYEFKFLLEHRSGHLEWENGTNRTFTVPKTAAEMLVEGAWGSTQDTEVLELQQQAVYRQQIQKLQQADEDTSAAERDQEATARAEAAAFAAANKAAAAAYQQQADAEAAAEAVERREAVRSAAEPARPPADMFKFDLSLLDSDIPGHAQLMQVLLGFRHDMVEGLTGVTSTMQEIQEELSQVQSQMQTLAAERFLAQTGPVDAETAEALESGNAVPWNPPADTAAIIAADAAVAQEAALSGLQGVVTVWQQELMNFREDSHDLRDEMETLRLSLEQQMATNTAAVQHLESQIRQLMALQGIDVTDMPPRPPSVVAAAAVAPPPPGVVGSSRPSTPGSGGPPGSSEMLDHEDKLLLERINHLASDLSEEMKEAVQELELQQQSLLERHQHIIADMSVNGNSNNKNRLALDLGFGAGLGMRMQPTMGGPGVLANGVEAGPHVTRAVARWLESRNVQQYHQGLLVAVLISCGLWKDSMWEPLENGALRATFNTYKSVWSEACLQTWKDNITTKQALMTALSTGRQQLLAMHILWSLQELCTHCSQLRDVLPEVATPIELGLMQKLRQKGGAGQGWALGVTGAPVGGGEAAAAAQCAVLLQRWLAAADGKW